MGIHVSSSLFWLLHILLAFISVLNIEVLVAVWLGVGLVVVMAVKKTIRHFPIHGRLMLSSMTLSVNHQENKTEN